MTLPGQVAEVSYTLVLGQHSSRPKFCRASAGRTSRAAIIWSHTAAGLSAAASGCSDEGPPSASAETPAPVKKLHPERADGELESDGLRDPAALSRLYDQAGGCKILQPQRPIGGAIVTGRGAALVDAGTANIDCQK